MLAYLLRPCCGRYGRTLRRPRGSIRVRVKLQPGQPGTKRLVAIYGDRLICVRYRYDQERRKRSKTVELIVDQADWVPPPSVPAPETIVYVRVAWGEVAGAHAVKAAGGRWVRGRKLWALRYDQAERLQLLDRLVEPGV